MAVSGVSGPPAPSRPGRTARSEHSARPIEHAKLTCQGWKRVHLKETNNEKSKKKNIYIIYLTLDWKPMPLIRRLGSTGDPGSQDPRTFAESDQPTECWSFNRSHKKTKHKSAMGVWDSLWNCQTGIVWAAKRNENAPWRGSQKWTRARFHQEHKCLNLVITQFKFVQKRHHENINLPS